MKVILSFLAVILVLTTYSQKRVFAPEELRNITIVDQQIQSDLDITKWETEAIVKSTNLIEEQIGDTRYDNQSNASIPNKIYYYDDGTIAATWTRSMDEGSFFADRGTGYNYYDGSTWSDWPLERIEDIKTHRPTYTPFGANGELVVSHVSQVGLYFASREEKGTGDWDFESYPGPAGNAYILWNRAVTSGTNRDRIHILALTLPTSHGGTPYASLDGALLYSLSTDGGNSWYWENEVIDGIASDEYVGFTGDSYSFAEPKGDVVAFTVGDTWYDLFLMKSTDGGESFDKTLVWEHPYPMWQLGTQTDTFYCADGSHSLAIDNDGTVHVAFGITRIYADDASTFLFPYVDGIAYWNENMDTFSDDLNALSPYGDPGSELVEDYNLIGWSQDINQNGQLDFIGDMGSYWLGLSSMPQLIIDDLDRMILVYSSVTETFDNGSKNYRHIWSRISSPGGQFWGSFTDLTNDLTNIFDECVYPAVPPKIDNDMLYVLYQADNEPGTAVWGAQHAYADNKIRIIEHDMFPYTGSKEYMAKLNENDVSQNYPNPFSNYSEVAVNLKQAVSMSFTVTNFTGQNIFETTLENTQIGLNKILINGTGFAPGIYFYTITTGNESVTKKMIVN